jgi:hypothetical protein
MVAGERPSRSAIYLIDGPELAVMPRPVTRIQPLRLGHCCQPDGARDQLQHNRHPDDR